MLVSVLKEPKTRKVQKRTTALPSRRHGTSKQRQQPDHHDSHYDSSDFLRCLTPPQVHGSTSLTPLHQEKNSKSILRKHKIPSLEGDIQRAEASTRDGLTVRRPGIDSKSCILRTGPRDKIRLEDFGLGVWSCRTGSSNRKSNETSLPKQLPPHHCQNHDN